MNYSDVILCGIELRIQADRSIVRMSDWSRRSELVQAGYVKNVTYGSGPYAGGTDYLTAAGAAAIKLK